MMAHLPRIFTKRPRHIFFESLYSLYQNEVRWLAVICHAKGENMEE